MAEYDVTIDGKGYMVGSYRRTHSGVGESRIGRVRLFDFFGGGQRAAQLERDRFWSGDGAWPAFDSQGIIPGPARTKHTEALGTGDEIQRDEPTWGFLYDGTTYIVQGDKLYEVTTSGGNYDGLSVVQTLDHPATGAGLARYYLMIGHGDTDTMTQYDFRDGSYTDNPWGASNQNGAEVLGAHFRIYYVSTKSVTSAGTAVNVRDANSGDTAGSFRTNAVVRRLVKHRGHVWAITEDQLLRNTDMSSDAAGEATLPQFGYEDDAAWAISHLGTLYVWLGKEVQQYNSTDRIFEPAGLHGRATHGAAVVGRYLVVNIERDDDGLRQLWSWDGRGWWLLDQEDPADSSTKFGQPISVYGQADDADLLCAGDENVVYLWQFFRRDSAPGYRDSMTLTSSLLDGGERDIDKVWRRIGAVFGWPDERTGTGSVNIEVEASYDAGETWATIATDTLDPGDGSAEVTGTVTGTQRSRFLQIRVTISGVTDWTPVLLGVWAEYEALDMPLQRRRWRLRVQASDTTITRDGKRVNRTAREQSDDLWAAWEKTVIEFRDVDYSLTSETIDVRVAEIEEVIERTWDADTLAASDIELSLVEV